MHCNDTVSCLKHTTVVCALPAHARLSIALHEPEKCISGGELGLERFQISQNLLMALFVGVEGEVAECAFVAFAVFVARVDACLALALLV